MLEILVSFKRSRVLLTFLGVVRLSTERKHLTHEAEARDASDEESLRVPWGGHDRGRRQAATGRLRDARCGPAPVERARAFGDTPAGKLT